MWQALEMMSDVLLFLHYLRPDAFSNRVATVPMHQDTKPTNNSAQALATTIATARAVKYVLGSVAYLEQKIPASPNQACLAPSGANSVPAPIARLKDAL
jgi:hypothetical protein